MKEKLLTLLSSLLFTLCFIVIGLCTALFFRPFYYMEIDRLDITAQSGFEKEEIIENYDALIDYCSPFYNGTLTFPTFSSSPEALIHFEEVKHLFNLFFGVGIVSFAALIFILTHKKRAKDYHFFRSCALLCIILPLIIGIASALNFDKVFVLFHEVFFQNDYWIFSAETDPVITILPEQFFMDCALIIAGCILIGSLLLYLIYRKFSKKQIYVSTNREA